MSDAGMPRKRVLELTVAETHPPGTMLPPQFRAPVTSSEVRSDGGETDLADGTAADESAMVMTYIASMPLAYRAAFDIEAMTDHARIVARRASQVAHVELWQGSHESAGEHRDAVVLCVVADDRPGLLSQVSAALVAHGIDVVSANAYCRKRPDGDAEAVDFLTIRRVPDTENGVAPVLPADVARISETLEALVFGRASFDGVVRFACAVRASSSSTRVRFEKDEASSAMILTVEAVDRPGLLLVLTQTLFRAQVQIIGVRATTDDGRAVDRFHLVELDGGPLRGGRLLELQTAVLTAIEETWRRTG